MSDLHALAYVSTAASFLTPTDLQEILTVARARNAKEQVTGLLQYGHDTFMQYIEGPREPLETIYASIRLDRRHRGLIQLLAEPTDNREFSQWAMAYSPLEAESFFRTCPGSPALALAREITREPSQVRSLLRTFWPGHRHS